MFDRLKLSMVDRFPSMKKYVHTKEDDEGSAKETLPGSSRTLSEIVNDDIGEVEEFDFEFPGLVTQIQFGTDRTDE